MSSSTTTLTLKQRALNAVMSVSKMAFSMLGNALIGLAISAAINVIGKLINAAEEARQKAQEAAETLQEENDTIDEQIESVIQLRKALDDNNLSESETANTKEQLLEIQTNLVDKYGEEAQTRMAIEEMSELTKEICKHFRGNDNLEHIAEEIADVEIMLDQLKMMFGLEEKTKAYRKYKIKRMVENL